MLNFSPKSRLGMLINVMLINKKHVISRIIEPDSAVSAFEASSATLLKVYGSVPSPETYLEILRKLRII